MGSKIRTILLYITILGVLLFPGSPFNVYGLTPTTTSPPDGSGIWISQSELMIMPTTGSAWQAILSDAGSSWGTANVSNQDSNHDQMVLAGALVCARTGQYCDKTRQGLQSAIGTEEGARWLAIGRNLLGYTIATDIMRNSGNLQGSELNSVSGWLTNFLTRTLAHNNSGVQIKLTPFGSGSNASAQEGAIYSAIAAYTKDTTKLTYAWNRFRLYSCDSDNNPEQIIDVNTGFSGGWSFASTLNEACAVNPKNTTKDGHRIDGAVINDIVRGGSFQWPPKYTGYEMTGLQGYVPAAVILHRAGFPSLALKDQAVLRAMDYVCYLENNTTTNWWETNRGKAIMHLVRVAYNYNPAGCQYTYPVGDGMTIGYTDWTHPTSVIGGTPFPTATPAPPTPTRTPTPVGPTQTPIPTSTVLLGDITGPLGIPDGKVDNYDYSQLISDFGKTGGPGFIPADINKNGKVDIFDYNYVIKNFSGTITISLTPTIKLSNTPTPTTALISSTPTPIISQPSSGVPCTSLSGIERRFPCSPLVVGPMPETITSGNGAWDMFTNILYPGVSNGVNERFTAVANPAGSGVVVRNQNLLSDSENHTTVGTGRSLPIGSTECSAFRWLWKDATEFNPVGWSLVWQLQMKGSPIVAISVDESTNNWFFKSRNGSDSGINHTLGPVQYGQWAYFVACTHLADAPNGWTKVWYQNGSWPDVNGTPSYQRSGHDTYQGETGHNTIGMYAGGDVPGVSYYGYFDRYGRAATPQRAIQIAGNVNF